MAEKTATCPDCRKRISLKHTVRFGQTVICPHCGAELQVVDTDPIRLDWIDEEYEEEEDW